MSDTCTRLEAMLRTHSGRLDASMHNETHLIDDLDLDSLDRIEFAMKIEEEFNIEMPDDAVDDRSTLTLGGLCAYVQGKLDAKQLFQQRA